MADPLVPCGACARHVRDDVSACPFCGAPHTRVDRAPATRPAQRSRAAIFAFGAAMGIAGCREEVAVPVYGAPAPPLDAGADVTDASPSPDGEADAVAVRYGAPPPPDWR